MLVKHKKTTIVDMSAPVVNPESAEIFFYETMETKGCYLIWNHFTFFS